jgi:hypothetical protein
VYKLFNINIPKRTNYILTVITRSMVVMTAAEVYHNSIFAPLMRRGGRLGRKAATDNPVAAF